MKKIIIYRLRDIKLASGKIEAFLLSLSTIIFASFLLALVSSRYHLTTFQITTLLLLLTVGLFQLSKFYGRLTKIYLYPGFFKRKILLSNLEKELESFLEIQTFSSLITNTLRKAFRLNKIAVLIKKSKKESFYIKKNLGFNKTKISSLLKNKCFSLLIKKLKNPFIIQEIPELLDRLGNRKESVELRQKIKKLKIEVVIPLFFERKVIGIIFLGEKSSFEAFSKEDINLLTTFSRQASIALKNTLLFSEVKKRKEDLERFYRLTVDKGIEILELKKKILELEEKLQEKS